MMLPPPQLQVAAGALSVTGLRAENQDNMAAFMSPFGPVYLVADGMGGHRGGATASRIAVEEFQRHLCAASGSEEPGEALNVAIRSASEHIVQAGSSDSSLRGMGSTVVIAIFSRDVNGMGLRTAHVGDSRAYLFRQGHLQRLTRDHNQVQWMVDTGTLDEDAARVHPASSVLTRALGITQDLDAEISELQPLKAGDTILLCSDGLSGAASSQQILAVLAECSEPNSCAEALVQLALEAGSDDNITVQVLRVSPEARENFTHDISTGEAK